MTPNDRFALETVFETQKSEIIYNWWQQIFLRTVASIFNFKPIIFWQIQIVFYPSN